MPNALYETDFYAWTQEQAAELRRLSGVRANLDLDLENLAEEVEDLGKRERREFQALLERVAGRLLLLEYSPTADRRRSWRHQVRKARREAGKYRTSTLVNLAVRELADIYAGAREDAAFGLEEDGVDPAVLPTECPYTFGQILDDQFFPANRHGLP